MESPEKRGTDMWGDGPALPRSPPYRDPVLEKIAKRDTPAGRLFEQRMSDLESLFLAAGLLAVLFNLVSWVVAIALAVLACRAVRSAHFVGWLKIQVLTLAVGTALLIGAAYGLEWMGVANQRIAAFFDFSDRGLILTAAHAVLVGGVLGNLFVLSCSNTFVRELKDRYPDVYREIERS